MPKMKKDLQVSPEFWHHKKVLITGGHGFVGSHLVEKLKTLKPASISIPTSKEADLLQMQDCLEQTKGIDLVIHLAAKVGGIGLNQKIPGEMFYDNLIMGTQLMEAARQNKVGKFVSIGTVCAYPKHTPVPFKEDDLWLGYPEETNAPYGLAKKMLLVQGQAYRDQYDFNAIYLLPVNMYGPGDNFDPKSSHVIPALIRKFVEAKKNNLPSVTVWGTGSATREFLYVEDAVRGILLAAEHYNSPEPVNLGSSFEISIKELANTIRDLTEYQGEIIWDSSKPDGQPRRKLEISKAKEEFGFESKVDFEQGLNEVISRYKQN